MDYDTYGCLIPPVLGSFSPVLLWSISFCALSWVALHSSTASDQSPVDLLHDNFLEKGALQLTWQIHLTPSM